MAKVFIPACLAAVLSVCTGFSQTTTPEDPATKSREAMKKLAWAAGEWKGVGHIATGPGARKESQVLEKLQFKLDGIVMLIEGRGTRTEEGKEVVTHSALAVISFNAATSKYEMKSWLVDGRSTDAWIELVGEKGFDWGFDLPANSGKIRYKMRINEKGQWVEKGEFSRDGNQYFEFFDMTLDKVKS